jgi:hypothetical protein
VNRQGLASPADLTRYELARLDSLNDVRNRLLDEGKYLAQEGRHIRVYLPSENEGAIRRYESDGSAKLDRARRLAASTPSAPSSNVAQTASRVFMKTTVPGVNRKQKPARPAA